MKAKELPEARVKMIDYLTEQAALLRDGVPVEVRVVGGRADGPDGPAAVERVARWWSESELFHVSQDMAQLAVAAEKTMPAFELHDSDLPSDYGIMVFDAPIGISQEGDPDRAEPDVAPIVAVSWAPTEENGVPRGSLLHFCISSADEAQRWEDIMDVSSPSPGARERLSFLLHPHQPFAFDGASAVLFGDKAQIEHRNGATGYRGLTRTVVCAWLLMQQQVASVGQERPDRPSRRRIEKGGHAVSDVRVVTLRHAASGEPSTDADREYRHRWLVRGHWRRQWYPSQKRHIPIWVHPHVKGPEGAPLLGGEKVYSWSR